MFRRASFQSKGDVAFSTVVLPSLLVLLPTPETITSSFSSCTLKTRAAGVVPPSELRSRTDWPATFTAKKRRARACCWCWWNIVAAALPWRRLNKARRDLLHRRGFSLFSLSLTRTRTHTHRHTDMQACHREQAGGWQRARRNSVYPADVTMRTRSHRLPTAPPPPPSSCWS